MSIRLRLTLLYSFILTFTLSVFGAALYAIQSQSTYNAIQAALIQQANGIANNDRRMPMFPSGAMTAPVSPGRWAQVRSPDGTVGARTADLGDTTLPLSDAGLRAVQRGAPWFETAQVDGEPLLILSQPQMNPAGRLVRIIQVAAPIAERDQALSNLRLVLMAGGALLILAAFVMGWVLAGMALAPIHRITHTAQAIGAERDFNRRVTHPGPNDEIGQLATTFNAMLTELESAYRQLQQALQTQRRFVADASHELRTPLTTLRGNLELLRRQPPISAHDQANVTTDSIEETDRLIRLVNDLLSLARADAGRKLRTESVALRPLLDDVWRQAKQLAPDRVIECAAALDVSIRGDHDALRQCLLVLLDNAITHTAPNAQIFLSVTQDDKRAAIHVRDTGAGIPPEQLSHIFERFYRGDASRTGKGAGLGLSIATELVEAQGGTLTVQSQVGQGSVFTLTLPRAKA